jgi:hypothetical protein
MSPHKDLKVDVPIQIEEVSTDLEAGIASLDASLSRTHSRARSGYSEKGGEGGYLHENGSHSINEPHGSFPQETVEPNKWWRIKYVLFLSQRILDFLSMMRFLHNTDLGADLSAHS